MRILKNFESYEQRQNHYSSFKLNRNVQDSSMNNLIRYGLDTNEFLNTL